MNNEIMDLPDGYISEIPPKNSKLIDIGLFLKFVLYMSSLIFYLAIIGISLFFLISAILHIWDLVIFDITFLDNLNINNFFSSFEKQISGGEGNEIILFEIIITYFLLIFILSDIVRHIIEEPILNIYIKIEKLFKPQTKIDEPPDSKFSNIYKITISALVLELFFKLYDVKESNEYINITVLISGILISSAIFIYVINKNE